MNTAFTQSQWIVNRNTDLAVMASGAGVTLLLLVTYMIFQFDMLIAWAIYIAVLGAPHLFGTYSRTYLDREEFNRKRKLYAYSIVWLAFGPGLVYLSYVLYTFNLAQYRLPLYAFYFFASTWAYWHFVRQHFGFLSIYKRKNNDVDPIDNLIDRYLLVWGLMAVFVIFIVKHPETRAVLGFSNLPEFKADSGSINSLDGWIQGICYSFIALISSAYILRQVYLWLVLKKVNVPKNLFIASVIPLYSIISHLPEVANLPIFVFAVFFGIVHDIQYLVLSWFHNKNKYHTEEDSLDQMKQKHGWAMFVNKNKWVFIFFAILVGFIFKGSACVLSLDPICSTSWVIDNFFLFGRVSFKELIATVVIGFSLHHYFIDQFIWRPSKDSELRKHLQLA